MTTTLEQLALLAEYYAEAVQNPEAWRNWEIKRIETMHWHPCFRHLHRYPSTSIFRRKPATIEITCRGKTYTLPEPMRVALKMGDVYWAQENRPVQLFWLDDCLDKERLAAGVLHATEEAARQWFDAMREIRGGKV